MDRYTKSNDQEEESMNFDDNYNQEEFLKQQNENKKVEKLSIMGDFTQLCQKLNHHTQEDKPQQGYENTLAQYYAKCKEKHENLSQSKFQKTTQNQQIAMSKKNQLLGNNKPNPLQSHHISSPAIQEQKIQHQSIPSKITKHERNPSQGEGFKKKTSHDQEMNESKRNYSSVEEKKKILQPSKNIPNNQHNPSIKDYFGEENNFVSNKVHGRGFIKNQSRNTMENVQHTIITSKKQGFSSSTNNQKINKQNNLEQSNLIKSTKRNQKIEPQKRSKVTEKGSDTEERPKVIFYTQKINLSQDPKDIIALLQNQIMKSDYEISNSSLSSIEEGLFGNAIFKQRATKTSQTVQSPNCNYQQPTQKEQTLNKKQYPSSPIPIPYSPNPSNISKSMFHRKEFIR